MVELTTRERVDEFWSNTLGVNVADLHTPGVRVYPNPPDRKSWRGIYALAFDQAACVFMPTDLINELRPAVAGLNAVSVLEPASWQPILGERIHFAFGPVVHYYLDDATELAGLATGRRLNPSDAEAFAALRAAVPEHEWTAAGFSAQAAVLLGIFDGEQLCAAANLTSGPDAATDVAIVVHPRARGRGIGLQMAATAASQALQMHRLARFRGLASSAPTLAIARRLGCVEYGRNLALYLH
jgi:GNAT superfamily N-acetyltransferase